MSKTVSRCFLYAVFLVQVLNGCSREKLVSYETVQSFRPAQGSVMMGYSSSALNAATRLSEVKGKCGTPIGEWEEQIPFFAKVKRVKYKSYDVNSMY